MKEMKRLKLNRETVARLGHETLTESREAPSPMI